MSDANLERMGEALYNLSDSLRETGFLTDKQTVHTDRYNEVVRAWHGLARSYERLARGDSSIATLGAEFGADPAFGPSDPSPVSRSRPTGFNRGGR